MPEKTSGPGKNGKWRALLEYGLAVLLVALATGFRFLLEPHMGLTVPYVTYFLSNALVIRFTRVGPSLFAIFLSTFAADFFFLPPRYTFWSPPAQYVTSVTFILANIVILTLARAMRSVAEKYSTIFDTTSDGVWINDMQGQLVEVNDAYCRMSGYSREELKQMPISKLEAVETAVDIANRIKKVLHSGGHDRFESRHRRKDGSTYDVEIVVLYLEREGGRFAAFVRDITERKQAEEVQSFLARSSGADPSEGFFHSLARYLAESLSADFVCIDRLQEGNLAAQTEAVYFDGKFEDNVAYALQDTPCGQVIGKTICCFSQEVRQLFPKDKVLQDMRAEGYAGVTLWSLQGQPIGLIALIWRQPLPNPALVESVLKLVAGRAAAELERQQAEEKLRKSEARLAQAVRVAGLGAFEHDHRTDAIEFSPVLREMLGFGENDTITMPAILERVLPEDREWVAAAIRRAHDPAGNGMFEVEYRVRGPGGANRWVSVRSQTFFEGEGNQRRPVRTIGATLDVTERKEAQTVLERLVAERTAKLQELVGELEHYSYTITHDMRSPLRAMRGFGEIMNAYCAECPKPEPKDFLRRISVSADRMDSLITDALNYNRAVRQELALSPVDAGALLRGMVDSYPELQPSKAQIQIQGEIPLVMGNEAALTQCFSNLLGNAVKFVKPGQKPEIRIWAERRDGWVRIWVEDKGVGIPESMHTRVFDMFSRGHQDYEGTGIGLALVRKVMNRMEGKVGVESEEGKGSRFWLDLKAGDVRSGR